MEKREDVSKARKPYSPPDIVFEQATEALASTCDSSGNCPSKDNTGTSCLDALPSTCDVNSLRS